MQLQQWKKLKPQHNPLEPWTTLWQTAGPQCKVISYPAACPLSSSSATYPLPVTFCGPTVFLYMNSKHWVISKFLVIASNYVCRCKCQKNRKSKSHTLSFPWLFSSFLSSPIDLRPFASQAKSAPLDSQKLLLSKCNSEAVFWLTTVSCLSHQISCWVWTFPSSWPYSNYRSVMLQSRLIYYTHTNI